MIDAHNENLSDVYAASPSRYDTMIYRRCGRSGIKLPILTLGLWHNFDGYKSFENARTMVRHAFNKGINHFDLANNYGPPYGAAERVFGQLFALDLKPYRDELFISSKAGYDMWPGPYGDFGSRKYLIASLDQSLKRTGLDYVDVFYHHRPDPETPLEETMSALDHVVRQGKALYAGISNYPANLTAKAAKILKELGTPCLIHQPSYSILNRWTEKDHLFDITAESGIGVIVFSPLQRGLLSGRYLDGVPDGSRASLNRHLKSDLINEQTMGYMRSLNEVARKRGQTLAQMSLAWVLRDSRVTSALFGASSVEQVDENLRVMDQLTFSDEELREIDRIAEPFIKFLEK